MTEIAHGTVIVQSGEAVLPRWWRTVDRVTIFCIFSLFAIGILLGFAASTPLAERNGLDPFYYVTRQAAFGGLALVLMLPALGLIANVSGLFGGALMSWIELDVSPAVFQARLVSNTDVWHFNVGMIKAPFFALIIGIIGCFQGMKVGGDAESLGRQTSAAVVMAIFMVIVADALFSIFFAIVGV